MSVNRNNETPTILLSASAKILRSKQKHLDGLTNQYLAEMIGLGTNQSRGDKVLIKEKIKELESEISDLEREIQAMTAASALQLEEGSPQVSQVIRDYDYAWQGKIHRIDFSQSRKIFDPILGRFENSGGAVLFFCQKSAAMGGDLCTQAIKESLDRLQFKLAPPREFTFESYDIAEPEPFLNFLASKYDLTPREPVDEDLNAYISRINQAIWGALYAGNVFLLQVQIKCELCLDDQFIQWFVNEFWKNLCEPLNPSQRIRLVGIFSVDMEVPKVLIDKLRCTKSKFDSEKLLLLPLKKWKKDEIYGWLIDHSGLLEPPISLSQTQLERMATSIYAKSNSGEPITVYSQLMDEMSRKVG
jgi:hypothetical protein